MKRSITALAILFVVALPAFGHCDWIKGPVVASAQAALEKGDVTPVLKWVSAGDEPEIRAAFARTLAAREGGGEAGAVADQWFFETLVRVHRATEGEPFTGLKGADYHPEPGIEMADHAVDHDSLAEVDKALGAAMRTELQKRFAEVMEARKHANESVDAGRKFVHAYAEFVHYVDGLDRAVHGGPHH